MQSSYNYGPAWALSPLRLAIYAIAGLLLNLILANYSLDLANFNSLNISLDSIYYIGISNTLPDLPTYLYTYTWKRKLTKE